MYDPTESLVRRIERINKLLTVAVIVEVIVLVLLI